MLYIFIVLSSLYDAICVYLVSHALINWFQDGLGPVNLGYNSYQILELAPNTVLGLLLVRLLISAINPLIIGNAIFSKWRKIISILTNNITHARITIRDLADISSEISYTYNNALSGYQINRILIVGEIAALVIITIIMLLTNLYFSTFLLICLLSLIAIVVMPLSLINTSLGKRRLRNLKDVISSLSTYTSHRDTLNFSTFRENPIADIKQNTNKFIKTSVEHFIVNSSLRPLVELIFLTIVFFTLLYNQSIMALSVDDIVIIVLFLKAFSYFVKISSLYQQISYNKVLNTNLNELIKSDTQEANEKLCLDINVIVEYSDCLSISFTRPADGQFAIQSDKQFFMLQPGGVWLINGKSGTGKSLLAAKIFEDLNTSKAAQVSKISVMDELDSYYAFKWMTTRSRLEQIFELIGLADELGPFTEITGKSMTVFSTGQRIRLRLCEELAKGFNVLILDEVISNLDAKNKKMCLNIIQHLYPEAIIVIIDHNTKDAQNVITLR